MTQPTSRRSIGSVVHQGNFYIYGGFGVRGTVARDDIGDDLWVFKDNQFQYINKGPYPARYPSLCTDGDKIYLFGGCGFRDDNLYFEDRLFYFDGTSWDRLDTNSELKPLGRYTNALCFYDDKIFIFGGYSFDENNKPLFLNDTWYFDIKTKQWHQLDQLREQPSNRYGFSWTQINNTLYTFGGYDNEKDLNDLWSFNFDTLKWSLVDKDSQVTPRYCSSLGTIDDKLILFGGRSKVNSKMNFDDTWIYDGNWKQLDEKISPYYHAKSGYSSNGNEMYIFAGEGPSGHVSDLWRLNSQYEWAQLVACREDDPILW